MEEEGGEQEILLNEEFIAPVTSVNGKVGDVVLKASDLENDTNYQNGSQVAASIAAHNESDTAHADIRQTLAGKQDQLSADQLNAVNSGIDLTKVAQIATNTGNISDIDGKIPNQATPDNQLADKAFVNSSVQTATANFRGSWANWAAVPNDANDYPADYSGSKTPTVNDYLVLQDASDYTGETLTGTWRFKYSGTWATDGKSGWHPEYQVNETPLTAAQLAALNSNITAALTQKLQNIEPSAEVNKINGVKVNGVLLTPDSDKNVDVSVPTDFYTKAEINAGTDNLSVPSGFFSDSTKTVSATGNPVELTRTSEQVLSDVRLLGDSFQQTYEGKNLLGLTDGTYSDRGVTAVVTNGEITVSGETTTSTAFVRIPLLSTIQMSGDTAYTLSANNPTAAGQQTGNPYMSIRFAGSGDGTSEYTWSEARLGEENSAITFTRTEPPAFTYLTVRVGVGIPLDNFVVKPQLERGSTGSDYEPYVGGIPAPNPDYPQGIQVVTGTQTITLNDGGSNTRTATVRLGSLELVKIGEYQDYIWNDNGTWKKHKAVEKANMADFTNWSKGSGGTDGTRWLRQYFNTDYGAVAGAVVASNILRHRNAVQWSGNYFGIASSGNLWVGLNVEYAQTTQTDFKDWLAGLNAIMYYPLTTPTDEAITDTTLIADLNALLNTKSFSPSTNVSSSAVSPNLPAFLTVEAFKNNLAGLLAGNSTHIDRLEARVADLEANP